MAEYIVTVTESANWQELHNELVNDGIAVVKLRATNTRNTHYNLTTEQATNLKNDPRVLAVQERSILDQVSTSAIQDADFSKTNSNWGLLRHTSQTNNYGTSSSDPGGTYDYVLDGTGVDVVIIDNGFQVSHPEFQDANGVSRVKEINWFNESGVSGNQSSIHYTVSANHGTHVAGTVAGKTYGWAKNANIYFLKIPMNDNIGGGIDTDDAFDCLKGWHNAKAGSRPTIVNCSFGWSAKLKTDQPTAYMMGDNGVDANTNMPAIGGQYRGTTHTDVNPIHWREDFGLRGWTSGSSPGNVAGGIMITTIQVPSVDVDIKQCIDAGIMFCMAASNENNKMVSPTNEDFNNYFRFKAINAEDNQWGTWTAGEEAKLYYMRPGSPNLYGGIDYETDYNGSDPNIPGLMVGALDTTTNSSTHDRKVYFSNTGNAVNIYAAGQSIKSSVTGSSTDSYNGTSMASPQVAGMCALLLQAHPDWTPEQVTNWFIGNAQDKMYSAGTTDWTDNYSILGGTPRVAYFPLSGQKPFIISGS